MSEINNSTPAQVTPNAEAANNNTAAADKLYPSSTQPAAPAAAPVVAPPPAVAAAPATEPQKTASPAAPVADEIKYDLKMPEEIKLFDKQWLEDWKNVAQENKLTNEQAQNLLNKELNSVKSFVEAQQQQVQELRDSWVGQVQADKEIGGEAYNQNVTWAKEALTKYGSPKLMEELKNTGFGSHPEVVRVFARIGKALNPKGLVNAGTQAAPEKKSIADRLYPTTAQQQ